MLRAYVGKDKNDWTEWLPMLRSAYNPTPAKSTEESPALLLLEYKLHNLISLYAGDLLALNRDGKSYWEELQMHREAARQAIVAAQDEQARHFNKKRTCQEFKIGEQVLLKPHRLEWKESKGEGHKQAQRAIGPFEVIKRETDQFDPNSKSTSKALVYKSRSVWLAYAHVPLGTGSLLGPESLAR